MSRPFDGFLSLCRHLRAGLLDDTDGPCGPVGNVLNLIQVSSQHLVTPSLAWCLRDSAGPDADAQAFFEAALHLNGRRNDQLLAGLARIVRALNAGGIEPMLLKGAAQLVGGIYPLASLRFLGDLDLLVHAPDLHRADDLLKVVGFAPKPDDPLEDGHHHLPMLHEGQTGIGVELHDGLASKPFDRIIPVGWFWEKARPVAWSGGRIHLPDPTRAAAHTVLHDQLVHHQYRWNGIELRQLLDLALLRKAHGAAIDWSELDDRFAQARCGRVLATYLAFDQALFGQSSPPLRSGRNPTSWPGSSIAPGVGRRSGGWPATTCSPAARLRWRP